MEQGTFMKCENCQTKPATVKLFKKGSPAEKKLCFNCEKQFTNIDQYKSWSTQHLPYSSLKQSNIEVSKSMSISTLDNVLKSPLLSTSQNLGLSFLSKNPLSKTIDLSKNFLSTVDLENKTRISHDINPLRTPTVRSERENQSIVLQGTLRDYDREFRVKLPETKDSLSRSVYTPKTNIEAECTRDSYCSKSIFEPFSSKSVFETQKPTTRSENPLKVCLSESRKYTQDPLLSESKVKKHINVTKWHTEEKNRREKEAYNMYIQERRSQSKRCTAEFPREEVSYLSEDFENESTKYTEIIRDECLESKNIEAEREYSLKWYEEEMQRREAERNRQESVRYYEKIMKHFEEEIEKTEKNGQKVITELKSEILGIYEEIEKYRHVENIRRTGERSKINAKMDDIGKEFHQETENKKLVKDRLESFNAQYEQQLHTMKVQLEKIQADAKNEVYEVEKNILYQQEHHSISMRDGREEQENYIAKMKREHQSKVCSLELEMEKLTDKLIKTEREKDEAVSEIELKLQQMGERLHQDETKLKLMRQSLEEKNERIERLKQKTHNVEQEAIVLKHEMDLIQKEKERLRAENKKLVAKYSKLNKIYHGK